MRAGSLLSRSGLPLLACGGDDLLLPGSDAPAALRLVSGDLQQGPTGGLLPEPLVVEAVDRTGHPVAGSRILFRFQAATRGATVDPDTALTDERGHAAAEVRLGQAPGGHPVEAILVDAESHLAVRFLLTALTRPEPIRSAEATGAGAMTTTGVSTAAAIPEVGATAMLTTGAARAMMTAAAITARARAKGKTTRSTRIERCDSAPRRRLPLVSPRRIAITYWEDICATR
jgi:hypothetical protein